ncbi:MAG: response regulator transcription factor [Chloroflexi bacterium]|nr:response regulator transcription factor [Chloroflexota bacterium]
MTKLLVVEDDQTLREMLVYDLSREGYEVVEARTGVDALDLARKVKPDLVLLDIMLPELDGLTVCRTLRHEMDAPIVLLTARSGEVDRIVGLDSGADDYIVKPFSLGELLARLRAVLRRGRSDPGTKLESGDLTLDLVAHRALLGSVALSLAPKEFDLLAELMQHKGAVLTRDLLLQRVWGLEFGGDPRTVDVHIRWLREKIEHNPAEPQRIETVRGLGYRFEG